MEANNARRKTIAHVLKLVSWVLFAIFALGLIWALFLIAAGNSPHDPAGLEGLLSLFGLALMVISIVPFVLGMVSLSISNKIRKSLATSQPTQTTSTQEPSPEINHPQTPNN